MLIKHGADVTAEKIDGETPLHLASEWGQVDAVSTLIEHGADVAAQRRDGQTPLHLASQVRQVDAYSHACRDADLTAQNDYRWTALQATQNLPLIGPTMPINSPP